MARRHVLEEVAPDPRMVDERGPTRERMARVAGAFDVGTTGMLTIRQSPIERGLKRGTFTAEQGRAAAKLYTHWYHSGMGAEIGSNDLLRVMGGDEHFSRLPKSERQLFHRQRLRAAVDCVRDRMAAAGHKGDEAVRVLIDVVCYDVPLEQAGARIGYLQRNSAITAALIMVRGGLNILVKDWGL